MQERASRVTKRILVIEDEPQMLLGLRDNLELEGYEVVTASDGEDGLAKAISTRAGSGDPRRHAAAQERLRGVPRAARERQPDAGGHARPRDRRRPRRCSASSSAPTTTSPSRSASPRCSRGCRAVLRAAPAAGRQGSRPAASATSRSTSAPTRRTAPASASTSPRASSICCATSSRHTGQVVTREQILNQVLGLRRIADDADDRQLRREAPPEDRTVAARAGAHPDTYTGAGYKFVG